MIVLDNRWFLDVNRFARRTPWGHGPMTAFFERVPAPVGLGLLLLAALVVAGWWSARREPDHMVAVLWSGVGALVALGLDEILVQVLARPRPYQVLHHVELLVPPASGNSYALPNSHAAIAGAALCGLILGRRWRLSILAAVVTLLLLFAGVYVGANYPSDMAAGAAFGFVVEIVLWPLGSWLLSPVVASVAEGPLGPLMVSRAPLRRPARPLTVQRPAVGLPNAKAMDALKAASEAARSAPSTSPSPGATVPVHTTGVNTAPGPAKTEAEDP